MNTVSSLKSKLERFPKVTLGFFPTPLHTLNNISSDLGFNLFIKREDFSGMSLFGGNKIRKLEFVLGDAIDKGASKILTFGATQSNHAMQTATACRQLGLDPVLLLAEFVKPNYDDLRSNFLLDHVLGADIHTIPMNEGTTIEEITAQIQEEGAKIVKSFESKGEICYPIPPGANNIEGAMGSFSGALEIIEQMRKEGNDIDYIVHTTGTGGSLSGLLLAKVALNAPFQILSISAADLESNQDYCDNVVSISMQLADKLGLDVDIEDLKAAANVDENYVGPGYEVPSEQGTSAIRYLAEKEGILTDPVYSGKGFAGLLGYVEDGTIKPNSNVVFIHSGGATALFSESQIVGNVSGQ